MTRAVVLGALFVASLGLAGSVQAQDGVTPIACIDAERPAGSPTTDGIQFAGEPGTYVSEPFTLPAGTVLYHSTGARFPNSFEIMPAPKSTGAMEYSDGGVAADEREDDGPAEGSGAKVVETAGEFVLVVDTPFAWTVTLEF